MSALLSLVGQAQTDTISYDTSEAYVNKNFSTYSSSFQFSLGQNLTVGSYGNSKTHFSDAYATTYDFFQLSVNALYTKKIKKRYGFEVGAEFFRNNFDWRKFNNSYLETTGDTMSVGMFFYEHLSLFGGANYNFVKGKLMITANAGAGILYNFPVRGDGIVGVTVSRTSIDGYRGGNMKIMPGIMPMFYSGLNLKYYLGNEFYIVANSHFTYSLLKINVTEKINFRDEREYLDKTISINNISLSLGVGTLL